MKNIALALISTTTEKTSDELGYLHFQPRLRATDIRCKTQTIQDYSVRISNIWYGLLSQPEQRSRDMRYGTIFINECAKQIFCEGFLDERSSG